MNRPNPRALAAAAAIVIGLGALGATALSQDRNPDRAGQATGTLALNSADRTVPVRIEAGVRYLFIASNPVTGPVEPGEARRIHGALESHGFRLVYERTLSATAIGDGIRRLLDGGVRPEDVSVLSIGKDVQKLIDVAQQIGNPLVNYLAIAGCDELPGLASHVPVQGRVLSLRIEKESGISASCRPAFAGRGAASGFEFEEIVVRRDTAGEASMIPELVLVEAVNAWTRGHYDDNNVR